MRLCLGLILLISGERVYKYIRLQEDGSGVIHYNARRISLKHVEGAFPYWREF